MVQNLLHIRDEKSPSTDGGTPISGTQIRDLNDVLVNEISGASLSSNQITLPVGTYEIHATAPAYRTDGHRIHLYNVTDDAIETNMEGTCARANDAGSAETRGQNKSELRGRFTVSGSAKVFEIRHYTLATTGGTRGLGGAMNDGLPEIYSEVMIYEIVSDFDLLHVRDEKASNTAAGSSSAATVHTRTLNTVITNEISGASLASDKITLPAGTYHVEASCPAFLSTRHKAYLYNTSDSEVTVLGNCNYARDVLGTMQRAYVLGQFIISESKDFELRHYFEKARATDGLGDQTNDGLTEVYAEVLIRKLL